MVLERIGKKTAFTIASTGLFASGLVYNLWIIDSVLIYSVLKYLSIGLMFFVSYFLIITRFEVSPENERNSLQKLLFVFMFSAAGMVFLSYFPALSFYPKVLYLLLLSVGFYLLLLAINVFIVSGEIGTSIPLMQPARVIVSITFILLVFFAETIIYKLEILSMYPYLNLAIKLILFFLFAHALFRSISWYIVDGYNKIGQFSVDINRVGLSINFSFLILAEVAVMLSFVPMESYGKALILAAHAYVNLMFSQLYSRHLFTFNEGSKFFGILASIYLLVYFI